MNGGKTPIGRANINNRMESIYSIDRSLEASTGKVRVSYMRDGQMTHAKVKTYLVVEY